jgi:hypothetical protein
MVKPYISDGLKNSAPALAPADLKKKLVQQVPNFSAPVHL